MTAGRRVLLMLGCSRASERGLLRGIARYARFHSPWIFYREPPFYRKPPFHRLPRQTQTLSLLRERGIDGLVAYAANAAQIDTLLPAGFPCVLLPIEEKIPDRCSIVEEAGTVGRMAAEHFLDRGFTRFAFCGFDRMYWSRVRQEGFTRRLAEAGFGVHLYEPRRAPAKASHARGSSPKDDRRGGPGTPNAKKGVWGPLSHLGSPNLPWEAEQTLMADWLRSLPKPIGLMVCNDDRAQQVIEANKAAGTRIPDEIAVLGVDNDDLICDLTHPPLSSIALTFAEAGYEAAAQLDRQMRGQATSLPEIHLRPTHIHTRRSTDVLAVENQAVAEALRFIRTHAGDILSVQEVVEATASSRRLLERHFRQTVGTSIYKEVQRAHIERACRMLVETNWPLAEVARQCGFSNPVHFSVAFKRLMHLTPEQQRRGAAGPNPDAGPSHNA